jgi:hypothetical protein
MINKILAILSAILAALAYGFLKGKKSIEILENEEAAKQVKEKNKYVDDARKLTDDERAKLVQKLTKKRAK